MTYTIVDKVKGHSTMDSWHYKAEMNHQGSWLFFHNQNLSQPNGESTGTPVISEPGPFYYELHQRTVWICFSP